MLNTPLFELATLAARCSYLPATSPIEDSQASDLAPSTPPTDIIFKAGWNEASVEKVHEYWLAAPKKTGRSSSLWPQIKKNAIKEFPGLAVKTTEAFRQEHKRYLQRLNTGTKKKRVVKAKKVRSKKEHWGPALLKRMDELASPYKDCIHWAKIIPILHHEFPVTIGREYHTFVNALRRHRKSKE